MKRIVVLIFVFVSLTISICVAQESKETIDYQYKRVDNDYHAYTAYANNEANTANFALVSSYNLIGLKSIHIKSEKNRVKLPFKKINLYLGEDDETLNKLAVSVNLEKILHAKLDCESTIIFTLVNNLTIELPINTCQFKEYLLKN